MPKQNDHAESNSDQVRVISHQLKSPINAIQTLLETISEGYTGESNPNTIQIVKKAVNRAIEARHIISDLLDYQAYVQESALPNEAFDVIQLLYELRTRYTVIAAEKELHYYMDLPVDYAVYIKGDERSLKQAFGNLLENAITYTPSKKSVGIRMSVAQNDICTIEFIDTGSGIPPEDQNKVFDPFFRSKKHSGHITGTGLGLPITKAIVEHHQGTIALKSTVDHGTVFTITLPILRKEKSSRQQKSQKHVIIVGGVTSGPKVAARLRRLDETIKITIIEQNTFLSYSGSGLPAYISGSANSTKELMSSADAAMRDIDFFQSIMNINILNNTRALAIDPENKTLQVKNLSDNFMQELPYDHLVLAMGSTPIIPDIPGITSTGIYTLHNLENAKKIRQTLAAQKAQDVIIIGGGLIGTSTAEALIGTGKRVTILEKQPQIFTTMLDSEMAYKLEKELGKKGIRIITEVDIQQVTNTEYGLEINTNKGHFRGELIIIAAGVQPNNELAKQAGLHIGASGGIKINQQLQTSIKDIYAVGDCAESPNLITKQQEYWPLGSISTKMGQIAADNIGGREAKFYGSLGTAMFKIVDINCARTGLTEEMARNRGFKVTSVIVSGDDRAHYTRQAENVFVKLIAETQSQKLLGVQMIGKGDIAHRVGIFATAITQQLTLNNIIEIDLGFYPAFNTPIDIVQSASMVLKNKIDGLVRTISPVNLKTSTRCSILCVCPTNIYSKYNIQRSINIPLELLRQARIPFAKDEFIVVYSRTSAGAYIAYRYLTYRGYTNIHVLEGGYEFSGQEACLLCSEQQNHREAD